MGTVAFLQDTWKKVNPASKFEYEFFDQELLITHVVMSDIAGILGVLALLAVIISCLGLLGMATYTAETRRKEISLRKMLRSSPACLTSVSCAARSRSATAAPGCRTCRRRC
jgi:putative ABC transport system permease protein